MYYNEGNASMAAGLNSLSMPESTGLSRKVEML